MRHLKGVKVGPTKPEDLTDPARNDFIATDEEAPEPPEFSADAPDGPPTDAALDPARNDFIAA